VPDRCSRLLRRGLALLQLEAGALRAPGAAALPHLLPVGVASEQVRDVVVFCGMRGRKVNAGSRYPDVRALPSKDQIIILMRLALTPGAGDILCAAQYSYR